MDFYKLREEAWKKRQILRITVYPDFESVDDPRALTDTDEMVKVEFIDPPKK
jgi:hypothetical protein